MSSFDDALCLITTIKLAEVEKQRLAYQEVVKALDDPDSQHPDDPFKRIAALSSAHWRSSNNVNGNTEIDGAVTLLNLNYWVAQAKNDPSFSPEVVNGWIQALEARFRQNTAKFDCAKLFGDLFTEWLTSGDSSATEAYQRDNDDTSTTASFEVVNEESRGDDYRNTLKDLMFDEPPPFDPAPFIQHLDEIFSSEAAKEALETIRRRVEYHTERLAKTRLGEKEIGHTLANLVASSLLPTETRKTLREIQNNQILRKELASIVNMRLNNLKGWTWPAKGVLVDMRRHDLTGKLRAFTDPDLIDGIMLHHLGIVLQVKFKTIFSDILTGSPAWNRSVKAPGEGFEKQLKDQLGDCSNESVAGQRHTAQRDIFFLNRLASSEDQPTHYDDVLDVADENAEENPHSPANVKKTLLRSIATESLLHQALGGSFAVFQTDLESFGPTLSHEVILAVFKYFGMPETWLDFLQRFLQMPLHFGGLTSGDVRIRQRGTPTAYALSTFIGEVLMFVMDFAVNQKSDGLFLYRMHDDMWLWDADAKRCASAWEEMQKCASFLGMKFNQKKSGSATVGATAAEGTLPAGDVRWGFLKYSGDKARFVIDQATVDHHLATMRRKLDASTSTFGWVNVYNKYMALFHRNFGGTPANCFGTEHIKDIVDTFARIQRFLFPGNGGVVGHLRRVITERHGVEGLPEGYFYLPIEYGGLALRNPIAEFIAVADVASGGQMASTFYSSVGLSKPETAFQLRMEADSDTYSQLKLHWGWKPEEERKEFPEFLLLEEYLSVRESWLPEWGAMYSRMLNVKTPKNMTIPSYVKAHPESSPLGTGTQAWFHKWNFAMHGQQLIKTFGGLKAVDPLLIPTGMVALFRSSKMST